MEQRPHYAGIPEKLQQQFAARRQTSKLFDDLLNTFFVSGGQIAATPPDQHGTKADFVTNTIYIDPAWFSMDADSLAVILAHELGHADLNWVTDDQGLQVRPSPATAANPDAAISTGEL